MPTLSAFYGITIRMYWGDHGPPHFHAVYAEHTAIFSINDMRILRGGLPRRAAELTLEWARLHQNELLENWHRCARNQEPRPIEPLA
jgi:hypothetical protein